MPTDVPTTWLACLLAAAGISAATPAAAQSFNRFDTVAVSDDLAPGSGLGAEDRTFTRFGLPSLSDDGEATFEGTLLFDPAVFGDAGIFRGDRPNLRVLAFEGQTAPRSGGSGADVPFSRLPTPVADAVGSVAFRGFTGTNADGGNEGVFRVTSRGTVQTLAFAGDRAPGSGGGGEDRPFTGFSSLSTGDTGAIAFRARTLSNPVGGGEGLFTNRGGRLQAIAFDKEIALGTGRGGPDAAFESFGPAVINGSGSVAFTAQIAPTTTGRGPAGLFVDRSRGLATIAVAGDPAPGSEGSGDAVPFTDFFGLSIDDSGSVLFQATTEPNADGHERGAFAYANGRIQPIAFEGQPMPGSGGGGPNQPLTRLAFGDSLQADGAGRIAFVAETVRNPAGGDSGIYSLVGDELTTLVFEGAAAPGTGVGAPDSLFTSFGSLALNNRGDVVFSATFEPNANGARAGVFRIHDDAIEAVLIEGEAFTDTDGVLRTVDAARRGGSVSFRGHGNAGGLTGLNNAGDLALRVGFDDGSQGVFIVSRVPEPSATALFVSALTLTSIRRKRPS